MMWMSVCLLSSAHKPEHCHKSPKISHHLSSFHSQAVHIDAREKKTRARSSTNTSIFIHRCGNKELAKDSDVLVGWLYADA